MRRKKRTPSAPTKPTKKAGRKKTPKQRFLDALGKGLSVTGAAEAAGMNRPYAYELREKDEQFRQDWDNAIEAATDRLEDAVFKRAAKTSDQLATFLLRARRPKTYGDRKTLEVTGTVGHAHYVALTDEQRTAKVVGLLDAARARASGLVIEHGPAVETAAGASDAGVP